MQSSWPLATSSRMSCHRRCRGFCRPCFASASLALAWKPPCVRAPRSCRAAHPYAPAIHCLRSAAAFFIFSLVAAAANAKPVETHGQRDSFSSFFFQMLAAAVPLGIHRGDCGCARAMRAPLRPSPAGGPRERASRERWPSPLVRARARSGNRSMRKPHQSGPRAAEARPAKSPGVRARPTPGNTRKACKIAIKMAGARAGTARMRSPAHRIIARRPMHAPPPVACLAGARGRVSGVVVVARGGGRWEARARPCGYGWDGMGWAQRACGC